MKEILEITGDDIVKLNDSDLRELVALLCEADLRQLDIPTVGVTWGGHQDAKDGGVDVRVRHNDKRLENSYIPRGNTVFQVKKPDMSPGKIRTEMSSKGILRPVIEELIQEGGAYIIVSSKASSTEPSLENRKKAMKEVVESRDTNSALFLDFYDKTRLASWVRSHPSLIFWVQRKVGGSISGWQSYRNWSKASDDTQEEYLLDDTVRLEIDVVEKSESLSALAGINYLRDILRKHSSSVRLTGLSGVGKTRFIQALFDERTGEHCLNRNEVVYTDMGDSPDPIPQRLAEQLKALDKRIVLVVDNCPFDLHRRLTKACSGSLLSLITVEHDVRDDLPEETQVCKLEPNSDDLIEKLIRINRPHVRQIDAHAIAKSSGGNARIALALANTIREGSFLSSFRDEDLFNRLFYQTNTVDSRLLASAEICSLVYSFDGVSMDKNNNELRLLSNLVGVEAKELFRHVTELKRRDLIQKRGIWRAVLPPALANKLAKRALENYPLSQTQSTFENADSDRFLRSFSRRLSYLHDSEHAKTIAINWLSEGGILNDLSILDALGIQLLFNIGSIVPETALTTLERSVLQGADKEFLINRNNYFQEYIAFIRLLAHDSHLFERCLNLLFPLVEFDDPKDINPQNSVKKLIESFFQARRSGTHASVAQRLKYIEKLISSDDLEDNDIGLELLSSTLKTSHFQPYRHIRPEFGVRLLDSGYWVNGDEQIEAWYFPFLELTKNVISSKNSKSEKAKKLLADNFIGIWTHLKFKSRLEEIISIIIEDGNWFEGWKAIKKYIKYHSEKITPDSLAHLNILKNKLAPKSLYDQINAFVFSDFSEVYDILEPDIDSSETYSKSQETIILLGEKASQDVLLFKEVLPKCLIQYQGAALYQFGQGLARGTKKPLSTWRELREHLEIIESDKRDYSIFCGFLFSISMIDVTISETILDELIEDELFSSKFPIFQSQVEINSKGVERLKSSLTQNISPISLYQNLALGKTHISIGDEDLSEILLIIASKQEGLEIAINILYMRLYEYTNETLVSQFIISVGQTLLNQSVFVPEGSSPHMRKRDMDRTYSKIIEYCFGGESSTEAAGVLCNKLIDAILNHHLTFNRTKNIFRSLAKVQPFHYLNNFLLDNLEKGYNAERDFFRFLDENHTPFLEIEDEEFLKWCNINPIVRFPLFVSRMIIYYRNEENNNFEFTSIALRILNEVPNVEEVLAHYKKRVFEPSAWSGSFDDYLAARLPIILPLKEHPSELISNWANQIEVEVGERIKSYKEIDFGEYRERDERFEW